MKKNKQFLYDYLNAYAPVAQETDRNEDTERSEERRVLIIT